MKMNASGNRMEDMMFKALLSRHATRYLSIQAVANDFIIMKIYHYDDVNLSIDSCVVSYSTAYLMESLDFDEIKTPL